MPHIILEISDNVIEKDFSNLFCEIHNILVSNLPTKLESCKSRAIRHKEFLVGDGDLNNAFVHLSISVLQGRSKEVLSNTTKILFACLKENLRDSISKLDLKISIELKELSEFFIKN
jgi:5-carboxymethyl-2-hydroxymuconate isomerase